MCDIDKFATYRENNWDNENRMGSSGIPSALNSNAVNQKEKWVMKSEKWFNLKSYSCSIVCVFYGVLKIKWCFWWICIQIYSLYPRTDRQRIT